MKSLRPRKCKAIIDGEKCRNTYVPYGAWSLWCSARCRAAIKLAEYEKKVDQSKRAAKRKIAKIAKEKRAEHTKRKQAVKTRSEHLKEAHAAFNEWIRYRDRDQLCINESVYVECNGNESDAAHFVSRAANSAMRFDLRNVHKSTKKSNANQEKWIHDYRENLLNRLGTKRFAEFEEECRYWRTHKRTFNIDYLIRIKAIFRKKKRVITKIRGD